MKVVNWFISYIISSLFVATLSLRLPSRSSLIKTKRNNIIITNSFLPEFQGFSDLLVSDLFPADTFSTDVYNQANDIQNLAILSAALAYFAYEKRPRGSANSELLEVKRSTVKGGNLGLFSKDFIAKGTKLGCYPGVVTTVESALRKSKFIPRDYCICIHILYMQHLIHIPSR